MQLWRCPKGILDHSRANTSVPQRGAHEQHPQHGGEGKAPHRAEAFVAMKGSEDRSQSATTRHTKGMTTGPLQIQPDIRREGTSTKLTGPENTRRQPRGEGRGETRRKRAKPQAPKPPEQTKKETTTTPKPPNSSNEREEPRSTKKQENHTRSAQAMANQNRDIQGRQEHARPRGTDPNTPHKTMHKRIREYEHTCPVCGQTYPHRKAQT